MAICLLGRDCPHRPMKSRVRARASGHRRQTARRGLRNCSRKNVDRRCPDEQRDASPVAVAGWCLAPALLTLRRRVLGQAPLASRGRGLYLYRPCSVAEGHQRRLGRLHFEARLAAPASDPRQWIFRKQPSRKPYIFPAGPNPLEHGHPCRSVDVL